MREQLKKNQHFWIFMAFCLFYLVSFFFLEQRQASIHIIHSVVDDVIPFCEYFIVPYFMWYLYIAYSVYYFAFVSKDKKEYYQLTISMAIGMIVFLIVSYVYPNGHDLRVMIEGSSFFLNWVKFLHLIDTSTNILPSLHVFVSVACCIAFCHHQGKHQRLVQGSNILLTISIILSTLFLKQHSFIDVISALILNLICYYGCYVLGPKYKKELSTLLTKKEICTIPNALSLIRIMLAIVILEIAINQGIESQRSLLIGLVCLSGLTDALDGYIARKYHKISEVGKILDPIADKLTQGVLLLCFIKKYPMIKYLFFIFVIKESYMAIMGAKALQVSGYNEGALWFGKINTIVFYSVMVLLLCCKNITYQKANGLLMVCGFCLIFAFICYASFYLKKMKRYTMVLKGEKEDE